MYPTKDRFYQYQDKTNCKKLRVIFEGLLIKVVVNV